MPRRFNTDECGSPYGHLGIRLPRPLGFLLRPAKCIVIDGKRDNEG
jgi:hypothetical protein